jgi:hypothetical protein
MRHLAPVVPRFPLAPVVPRALLAISVWFVCGGCAHGEPACQAGAECPSRRCGEDGRCVSSSGGDASGYTAPTPDGGTELALAVNDEPANAGRPDSTAGSDGGADAMPRDGAPSDGARSDATPSDGAPSDGARSDATPSDGALPDGPLVICLPNHDGVITRAEVPVTVGTQARFVAADGVEVNMAGIPIAGGRRWDLGAALSNDHRLVREILDVRGQWFAAYFPEATYAARLSDTNDLLAVYQLTDDALLLLGVASPAAAVTQTVLSYNPPVTVIRFPLQADSSWQTDATVTGQASGVVSYYAESYSSHVDAAGEVVTPSATYPVLRLNTVITRTVGVLPTVVRSFVFVSECVGSVATVRSQDNEAMIEFARAAEVWRLGP